MVTTQSTVKISTPERIVVYIGGIILGLSIGIGLSWIPSWLDSREWIPEFAIFDAVANVQAALSTVLGAAGLAAGVLLARLLIGRSVTIKIAADSVAVRVGRVDKRVEKNDISAVFDHGRALVMLDRTGHEILHEKHDLPVENLAKAFTDHDYPWMPDGDPYAAEYQQWADGTPELPQELNALMLARRRALRNSETSDARLLRESILDLGYVVIDNGGNQLWRRSKTHR